MKRNLLFFILLLICKSISAQLSNSQGIPLIKNFTKEDVKSSVKVFNISQSKNGEIYFAIQGSLLTFDGFNWNVFSEKNKTDLRDILYINDQEIYTSGHGGFGVWSKNKLGQLEYKSLFFKTPTKEAPLLPVFRNIIKIKNKIYFQSFQQIYVLNTLDNSIEILYATKGFCEMFSVEGKLFVQDSSVGLFEVNYSNHKKIIEGTQNNNIYILNVFKEQNTLLLATRNKGFWKIEGGKMKRKNWDVNQLFQKHFITDIKKYDKKTFLIGTLRNGVYLMSIKGEIINHINKEKGIENNSVRKLFIDNNKNVWIATEAGLSYLEFHNNLKFFLDKKSEFGTVYTSLLKDSILYLGTNQGLFKKNIHTVNSKAILIDNTVEQIWQIYQDGNQILVGSHKGVYKLHNNELKTIHLEGGAWTFKIHPIHKDLMYVGFYSGLAVFRKVNNNWVFVKKFREFADSSRFIEFDDKNQIWISHPEKGYYRLALSENGLVLKDVDFYGISNPAVEPYAYFTKIDGNLIFFNPSGFFSYNAIDNVFTNATYPSKIFEGLKNINHIQQVDNLFWYSTDKFVGYIIRNRGKFKKTQSPFYKVWDKNLKDFNKFKKLKNNLFSINIENGIALYSFNKNTTYTQLQKPITKAIKAISSKDTMYLPLSNVDRISVPYKNNYIKVDVALPNLPYGNFRGIQYRLKGFQDNWSVGEEISEINFTGLRPGEYDLEIRSNIDIDNTSEISIISFEIENPWYFNSLAKFIYIISFLFVFYIYNIYLKRKNSKYVAKLKKIEEQRRNRQKDKYELDKLASDKELLLLKEKNLNLEIKKKNSALASSTLNNIKKNELLSDLIKDIKSIDKELLNNSLHHPIKKVLRKINNQLKDKEDWLTFELHFRNSHSQFFENLRKTHPNLSSNEIKLSAYLKLNLSSKEIASLMHIAVTSVEQSRYRLRKKFDLEKDNSLIKYIQKF